MRGEHKSRHVSKRNQWVLSRKFQGCTSIKSLGVLTFFIIWVCAEAPCRTGAMLGLVCDDSSGKGPVCTAELAASPPPKMVHISVHPLYMPRVAEHRGFSRCNHVPHPHQTLFQKPKAVCQPPKEAWPLPALSCISMCCGEDTPTPHC